MAGDMAEPVCLKHPYVSRDPFACEALSVCFCLSKSGPILHARHSFGTSFAVLCQFAHLPLIRTTFRRISGALYEISYNTERFSARSDRFIRSFI